MGKEKEGKVEAGATGGALDGAYTCKADVASSTITNAHSTMVVRTRSRRLSAAATNAGSIVPTEYSR